MHSGIRDSPIENSTEILNLQDKMRKRSLNTVDSGIDHDNDKSNGGRSNQLVVYSSGINEPGQDAYAATGGREHHTPLSVGFLAPTSSGRVLPSIGAFAIQCASCHKWRLIPTKEKYEQIRENILQEPFHCKSAREWRPDILCEDPEDISPNGSKLWAIDKPNISQPPPGWERLLKIRGQGSRKFADVYYVSPSGKKLRSMVEVERFICEHPEYVQKGVNLSQFSFQIPRPLKENYVGKRPAPSKHLESEGLPLEVPGTPPKPYDGPMKPLNLEVPESDKDLQSGEPRDLASLVAPVRSPICELRKSPAKKLKVRRPAPIQMADSASCDQPKCS